MDEERSGSEQPPDHNAFSSGIPPAGSSWSASQDGTVERLPVPEGDTGQAQSASAATAASPEPDTDEQPAVTGAQAHTSPGGQWAGAQVPGPGEAGGYRNPAVVYPGAPPPGAYPPGAGYGAGYPGGYGPGYPGGHGSYYQPGYPGGYQGPGYPPNAGYQGVYGPSGYPGAGGYQPGYGYGPDIVSGGYGQDRPPRRSRILTYVVVAALAAGVGAGTVLALRHNDGSNPAGLTLPNNPSNGALPGAGSGQPNGNSGANSSLTQSVASKVSPGIVDIISTPSYSGQATTLEGTGMILTHSGLVLTNNHVVEGTSSVEAKIADTGQTYKITVLGTDAVHDVALLKIVNPGNLTPVSTGDSSKVQIGETVVALGNAEGQDGTPTVVSGRITSLNQSIQASDAGAGTTENLHGMLQTNAPIVSGDSGGALADAQGKVIGMNTAANSSAGTGASMGFAIPINRALSIASQILAGHATSDIQIGLPAFLGVTVATSNSASGSTASTATSPSAQQQQLQNTADQNGFGGFGNGQGNSNGSCLNSAATSVPPTIPSDVSSGALVGGVLCGTPVIQAGITEGSVITSIDGQTVSSPASLTKLLTHYHPGDTVSITWVAPNGSKHTASVKLASGPAK